MQAVPRPSLSTRSTQTKFVCHGSLFFCPRYTKTQTSTTITTTHTHTSSPSSITSRQSVNQTFQPSDSENLFITANSVQPRTSNNNNNNNKRLCSHLSTHHPSRNIALFATQVSNNNLEKSKSRCLRRRPHSLHSLHLLQRKILPSRASPRLAVEAEVLVIGEIYIIFPLLGLI